MKKTKTAMAVIMIFIGGIFLLMEMGTDPWKGFVSFLDVDGGETGYVSDLLYAQEYLDEQFFSTSEMNLDAIAVRSVTWNHLFEDSDYIYAQIIEKDTGTILDTSGVKVNDMPDNDLGYFNIEAKLKPNTWYIVRFYTNILSGDGIALMLTDAVNSEKSSLVGDLSKDICIVLYTEEDGDV